MRVETVADPKILASDDIIIQETATAICGSDLHLYRGKVPGINSGDILGHEFTGLVTEKGRGVTALQIGDRVVIPFTISCGDWFFCNLTEFASCENTNPGPGGLVNNKNVKPAISMRPRLAWNGRAVVFCTSCLPLTP